MKPTIRALADRLERDAPVDERLSLCFGGQRIDVYSNSSALLGTLRGYFEAFDEGDSEREADLVIRAHQMPPPDLGLDYREWSREPGKQTRKEAFFDLEDGRAVRKVRTDMQFLIGPGLRVAVGDCLANPNQIINFINFQYTAYLMNRGLVLCHAAGVIERRRGLGLAAVSGGGKSTLALHLMSAGLSFTSNDRLLVGLAAGSGSGSGADSGADSGAEAGPDGGAGAIEMTGIPKHPRINPGTALANPDLRGILSDARRAELDRMPRNRLWELEEKYDALVDRLFGRDRVALHAPMTALVVLGWSHLSAEPARFERVDLAARRDLLETLMKAPGPFYLPDRGPAPTGYEPPDPKPYLEALAGLPVYAASGGVDFEAGVRFCRTLLAELEPDVDIDADAEPDAHPGPTASR